MRKFIITFSRTYEYDEKDLQPEPDKTQAITQAWSDFENDMEWMRGNSDTFSAKVEEVVK